MILAAARTPPTWSGRNLGVAAVRMMMILVPKV